MRGRIHKPYIPISDLKIFHPCLAWLILMYSSTTEFTLAHSLACSIRTQMAIQSQPGPVGISHCL